MSVVKPFSSWHAIELTFAWCFQVWNPVIQFPFEWNRVELLTLFKSEIFGVWGTFLGVATRVPFGRSSTITILALSRFHQDSSSTSSWTVLIGIPIAPFSRTLIRIGIIHEREYTYVQKIFWCFKIAKKVLISLQNEWMNVKTDHWFMPLNQKVLQSRNAVISAAQ